MKSSASPNIFSDAVSVTVCLFRRFFASETIYLALHKVLVSQDHRTLLKPRSAHNLVVRHFTEGLSLRRLAVSSSETVAAVQVNTI